MPLSPFPRPALGAPPNIHLGWVMLLCAAWLLPGLIGHDPWKPDDAYSFGLVHSLLEGADWIVPMLAGEPALEKPPLYYLTAAGLSRLLSNWLPLHDGARLSSGLYMALTLIFTGLAGRELWGKGYGRLSALILVACLGLLVRAHQLVADTAMLAGFALAFYGFALAPRRFALAGTLAGTGMGIGFMAGSMLAPLIITLTALFLPLLSSIWRIRSYFGCLAIYLASALPWLTVWPYLLYQHSPQLFVEWLEISEITNSMAYFAGLQDPSYYLRLLPWFAWPAFPLALWTLWHQRRTGWRNQAVALPVLLFVVTLMIVSFATSGRDIHALPLLPPLAVLGAAALESLRRGAVNALDWFSVMTFSLFAAGLWLGWYATLNGYPALLAEKFEHLQPGYSAQFDGSSFLLAMALSLAWLLVILRTKRGSLRAIINSALGITLVWGLLATIWLPWLDAGKSYRAMFSSMQTAMPFHYDCLASRNLGEAQRAMLHYFTGIISEREERYQTSCNLLLIQDQGHSAEYLQENWNSIWAGRRAGDESEWFSLYRRK